MKRVTVFGATGKVGSKVVVKLLEQQNMVTAFVYGGHAFAPNPNLVIVQGDIYNATDVATALRGSEAVFSALGSWGTPKKDILTAGMRNIIPAMLTQDIKRIITLTGADARAPGDKIDHLHAFSHAFFGIFAGKILDDGENHIKLLSESELDWTILRSPVMNEFGKKGSYVLRERLPGLTATIHRDDVAAALVDLLDTDQYNRRAPVIYRK
jgi:putative NADH-flavin reductase